MISAMHQRGGISVRTPLYVAFFILFMYLIFIYHGSQTRLHEAEMTGSRYKREAEEKLTEIQDIVKAKDRCEESCRNEKTELNNRIKSINQQQSMLQSQYKETEADYIKLRQDMDTMKAEHSQAESAHAQEYERLKQEKELDIARLKDEIADMKRKNTDLENTIITLREQIKNSEELLQNNREQYMHLEQNFFALQNAQKNLMSQNAQLQQQQLQYRQHIPQGIPQQLHEQKEQEQQKQPQQDFIPAQQGLQLENHEFKGGSIVKNMQIKGNEQKGGPDMDKTKHFGHSEFDLTGQGDRAIVGPRVLSDRLGHVDEVKPHLEDVNAPRQVQPPNNNNYDVGANEDEKDAGDDNDGFDDKIDDRPPVNPNDEQKGQILEPILEGVEDKHLGGGEAGVDKMNARGAEEAREKEEADFPQHKNPLALGQIEVPDRLNVIQRADVNNNGNLGQQMPPLLEEENHHENEERHYFGEEDEDAHLDEEGLQEEEGQERDKEEADLEDEHFPDEMGNLGNNQAFDSNKY